MIKFWDFPSPVFGLLKREGNLQGIIIMFIIIT